MDFLLALSDFLSVDPATATKVLFLGNFSFCILAAVYRSSSAGVGTSGLKRFMFAKGFQAASQFMLIFSGGGDGSGFADISLIALFFGVFLESLVMISLSRHKHAWAPPVQSMLFAVILIFTIIAHFVLRDEDALDLVSWHLFQFILLLPGVLFIESSHGSALRRILGGQYLAMFALSFARGCEFFALPAQGRRIDMLFDDFSFMMLILIMLVGSTGILLLAKEESDLHIRDLAFFDSLTGLMNRRHFVEEAGTFVAHHARYRESMAALFIDLDHFKRVNDTYGHGFGDEVLKDFGVLLGKEIRASDLCGRYGGEEFIVFLARTNADYAESVARRILGAARLSRFVEHPDFAYSVSIGIYVTVPSPGNGDTVQSCIEKSDHAMYRAKTLGRDRAESYFPEMA
jgi:diguanylate cyclase (GGDEF)-like protein